ncbi:hypothetical protein C8Q70DRAFT_1059179 [Cubamyces menziesii]|nr:hypothetical protein C8Q70DRAFT_1059179 [Cubamyces menziesii]
MTETQEGPVKLDQSGVSESTQKLHADVGHAFQQGWGLRREGIRDLYHSSHGLFTKDERREALVNAATITKGSSDAFIERWIKEIDTYLVYAGLFSAILTAFNVESYQLLQPAPPDPAPAILQQISLQLGSLSYIPPSINSTYQVFNSSDAGATLSSVVPTWAVWLNALWFSGLVLSLSAASVGILVKQWLNEFQSGLSGDSEHIARLRQYRLNNLKRCHVGSIVNTIPVLLQGALALFLAGLLVLLWNLHRAVAAITSIFVLAIAVFIVSTTIAPLVTSRCAYLSPQSLVLYALWPYVARPTCKWLSTMKAWLFKVLGRARDFQPTVALDDTFTNMSAQCKPPQQSWIARERSLVKQHYTKLEADMTLTAYEATLDIDVIASALAGVVNWNTDDTLQWFVGLVEIDTFHFGKLQFHFHNVENRRLHAAIFYGHILLCATLQEHPIAESVISGQQIKERFLDHLEFLPYYRPAPSEPDSWGGKLAWIAAAHAALMLCADARVQPPSPPGTGLSHQQLEVDQVLLDLMARAVDSAALKTRYNTSLVSGIETCAIFAFRALRESNYSLDKPFEYLGTYLRGHALLLHFIALRSRVSQVGWSKFLEEGVKDALSDLSATLNCLSRSRLDDAQDSEHIEEVEFDIVPPLAHLVHTLSCEIDSSGFRLLLPPDFCVSLELFVSEFRKSALYEEQYWVIVPWENDQWYLPDLFDAALTLIEKLRNLANRDTRAMRRSQPTSYTPIELSNSSDALRKNEKTSPPASPSTPIAESLTDTQLHSETSHRHASASIRADWWMYYGNDFPETQSDGASPPSTKRSAFAR